MLKMAPYGLLPTAKRNIPIIFSKTAQNHAYSCKVNSPKAINSPNNPAIP